MSPWVYIIAAALVVAAIGVAIKARRDEAEYRRHRDLQNRWRS